MHKVIIDVVYVWRFTEFLSRERAFSLVVMGSLAERTFVALLWLRVIKRKEGCDTSPNYLFCSFQLFVLLYIGIFLSLMKT